MTSSSAVRTVGNQAFGFVGRDLGHRSEQVAHALDGGRRARRRVRARRATSRTAKVSHAWNTSWATSAGWNGASNGNGGVSGCAVRPAPAARPPSSAAAWCRAPRRPPRRPRRGRRRGSDRPRPPATAGARCRRCPEYVALEPATMPSCVGQPARRVVVGPAHAVHDVEPVDRAPARRRSPRRRPPAAAPPRPHVQRLGRLLVAGQVPGPLGHPDDAGRTRIEAIGHGHGCPIALTRPCQLGGRFSLNALGPSLASSVAKIFFDSSCFDPVGVVERAVQAADDRLLGGLHRERGVGA